MSCTDSSNYGPVCTYTCYEEYYNSGGTSQKCEDPNRKNDDSKDDGQLSNSKVIWERYQYYYLNSFDSLFEVMNS